MESKQMDVKYPWIHLGTATDSNGHFELNGAMPNDTIHIMWSIHESRTYMNKGSRFMIIYLPAETPVDLNSGNPVMITTNRKTPKVIPSFKIVPDNSNRGDSWEHMPDLIGGVDVLFRFIKKTLAYPNDAVINNIEGTVEITFLVNIDGSLSDFKVARGIGHGCDEAAVEVLKKSPKWRPGRFNGRAVKMPASVSILFKLTD
jgi:TonB family protein